MKIFIGEQRCCYLNYQHEYITDELSNEFEIVNNVSEADIIVFPSSCACTENSILEMLNYIEDCLRDKKNDAKVYLTGCLTRKFKDDPFLNRVESWLRKNVDFLIPQNDPNLLLHSISEKFSNLKLGDFGYFSRDSEINEMEIYIGNGCLNNCAFCKISYQEYKLKSVDIDEIKYVIDYANQEKISTITLVATNISQYGIDLYGKPMLPNLIEYIEQKEFIKNLNLVGFAYKDAIENDFAKVLSLCSKNMYISGSLETGSPRLLKMIRKGYTPEEIISFIQTISKFYARTFEFNIIAGLPTETIDDIKETLKVLKELRPYLVQICEYDNSSFLELNDYPQLSDPEIRDHARIYNKVLTRRKVLSEVNHK